MGPSAEVERMAQPYGIVSGSSFLKGVPDQIAYPTEPLGESDNLLVRVGGGIEEGSMANVVPEPEDVVTEVLLHKGLELDAVDVLVHGAVENEVGKSRAGLHQGGFVLGVGNRPNTNVWVLTGNGSHPRVLGCLIELISKGDARLGELLGSRTEVGEGRVEQPRNEVQDVRGGDLRVHIAVGEGAHQDNAPDQVGTIVCRDVSGDHTAHGPTTDVIDCTRWGIKSFAYQPAKIGLFFPIPK